MPARTRYFSATLLLLAFLALFLGFYRNQWQVVREKKFSLFQKDVESYVIARLVQTRQSGLFSYGGLLGWGDVNSDPQEIHEEDYQHQYDTYLEGRSFGNYVPKESHPGFQGLFFSALDRLSPFAPSTNLRLFRMLASALFAATLTSLIAWFCETLGWLPALFVFGSILSSQWMTLFGRNLFFFCWIFYLPFLVLLWRMEGEAQGKVLANLHLFWLSFAFILMKCLFNGYDFILPTLGMAASPIVFYGLLGKWRRQQFIRRFALIVLASLLAILASLIVLAIQNVIVTGSVPDAVSYIIETYQRRTLAVEPGLPSIYAEARAASLWSILEIYLNESYFGMASFPYYAFILIFAAASILYLIAERLKPAEGPERSKGFALLAVTWFSLLSPLSWYVIFKSVAYFHTHMNYLPFHMPFTLFGFALCGFTVDVLFRKARSQTNK